MCGNSRQRVIHIPPHPSTGMNSAPGSASSDSRPPPITVDALRPQKAEGDLVRGRDARRGGAANRTTRTAKRDIRDIGAPHTGFIGLTGPWGRCTMALNPRKESRIPHHRKPQKHCNINYLERGGGRSLERTCLWVLSLVTGKRTGKKRESGRYTRRTL